jgi:hypothetical protein
MSESLWTVLKSKVAQLTPPRRELLKTNSDIHFSSLGLQHVIAGSPGSRVGLLTYFHFAQTTSSTAHRLSGHTDIEGGIHKNSEAYRARRGGWREPGIY